MSLLSLKKMRGLSPRPFSPKKSSTTIIQDAVAEGVRQVEERKVSRKSRPGFKASALGGPCLRCALYAYLRLRPDKLVDAKGKLMMEMGHAAHHAVKALLRETMDVIELNPGEDKEFMVREATWPLMGFLDSLIVHEGRLWLLEIKSVNQFAFQKLEEPKPTHKVQTAIYFELFSRLLRDGELVKHPRLAEFTELAGTIYLYVHRDFGAMKEFWHTPNPETFQQVEAQVHEVKAHVAAGTLPPRAENCDRYSDFARKCKADFDPFQ